MPRRSYLLPPAIAALYLLSAILLPVDNGAWWPMVRFQLGLGPVGILPPVLCVFMLRRAAGGPAVSGWAAGVRRARLEGWFGDRLAGFFLVFLTLPAFFWAFAAWKTRIPPFTADAAVARVDAILHGGPPNRWIPSSPNAIRLMAVWYETWYVVLICLVLWQGWCGTRRQRTRFCCAFVLTWIGLGTLLAHAVPSAGPVFYDRATGDPRPYADLRAALRVAGERYHLSLGAFHDYLWSAVARREVVFGGGVSAFPSLHIAIPALAACAAWRVSPWLSVAFMLYDATLLVCSVGLGWHYAVDGYVAIALVPALWWAAGRLIRSDFA